MSCETSRWNGHIYYLYGILRIVMMMNWFHTGSLAGPICDGMIHCTLIVAMSGAWCIGQIWKHGPMSKFWNWRIVTCNIACYEKWPVARFMFSCCIVCVRVFLRFLPPRAHRWAGPSISRWGPFGTLSPWVLFICHTGVLGVPMFAGMTNCMDSA